MGSAPSWRHQEEIMDTSNELLEKLNETERWEMCKSPSETYVKIMGEGCSHLFPSMEEAVEHILANAKKK